MLSGAPSMTRTKKLFATDLDGTLLDRDGRIHPRDARAIGAALEQGAVVTIATGRLTAGTHWVARELGLTAPLVCADGGIIACGETEEVLHASVISLEHTEAILDRISGRELASFVFTHSEIHGCERGRDHHPYVRGWSPNIMTHADVRGAEAWREPFGGAVMVLGIGGPEEIAEVHAWVRSECSELDTLTFTFGDEGPSVIRAIARGVSKGTGLARVADRLGIARADVAVIGDWLNDLPMFEWAGRSYAMPHAPEIVKKAATHHLRADACKHGAIAEAIEHFLAGP